MWTPPFHVLGISYKIADAIKMVESGGDCSKRGLSGERGCYQILPSTWHSLAKKYLATSTMPMTPAVEQKVVLMDISDLSKTYTPYQVALIWNGGEPVVKKGINQYGVHYDSGAYAREVVALVNE